jgi:hypothetical protein
MKKRPTGFLRAMPDRRVTDDGARVRVSRVAWINLVTHTHHQLNIILPIRSRNRSMKTLDRKTLIDKTRETDGGAPFRTPQTVARPRAATIDRTIGN